MAKRREGILRAVVLPDMHIPHHDKRTMAAVHDFMYDFQPDEIVQLGDFLSFEQIAHYNKSKLRKLESKRLLKDYAAGAEVLDIWDRICPNSKITILEGNHDHRIEKYIDEHPETEGLLEMSVALGLEERGINYVRFHSEGKVYRLGKAVFAHGIYTSDIHTKAMVSAYGEPIFYGHCHDIQCYSKILNGDNKTIVGQSLGCLNEYKNYVAQGFPNRHQQAFAVFYIQPNGFFNYYVVSVFNHKFVSPNGKEYAG